MIGIILGLLLNVTAVEVTPQKADTFKLGTNQNVIMVGKDTLVLVSEMGKLTRTMVSKENKTKDTTVSVELSTSVIPMKEYLSLKKAGAKLEIKKTIIDPIMIIDFEGSRIPLRISWNDIFGLNNKGVK
jgi:plastocyanin domain-containing protein